MNHSQKFIFLGAVVAIALFSRFAYPWFSGTSEGAGAALGTATSSFAADAPLFIFTPSTPASNTDAATVSSAESSSTATDTASFAKVGSASSPAIGGQVSLIADLETGDVFLSENADKRWPLASVTKLMTASVVLDDLDPNQKITITAEAVAVDPGQTLLNVGDTYTVSDLLHALLMPSSNVAAEALADYYGRAEFLAAMNDRAVKWGMADTHYDDPSGLSAGNETTADDLLKLAQHIYEQYPQIFAITRTPRVTITEFGTGKKVAVNSINDFAGQANFIGGKTGYTNEANGNLLSIFSYENRPVLVIVMGTDDSDRFHDTLALYRWFTANFK